MKRIISAICAIVMLCMMTGCESSNVREGRELYRAYLNKTLIVPDEMKIYNESFVDNGAKVEWTVDVGGTTRKGNRFRETMRFETTGGALLKVKSGDDSGRLFDRADVMN